MPSMPAVALENCWRWHFFSLLMFLGLSAVVKRHGQAQRWVFSGLGMGMVALVGVMLVSAFQRLVLYETAYGFSRLRTYTHVFLIWLGVLLAVVLVLDVLRRERAFALAALLAAIGFGVTLNLLNVDAFIARQNVARAAAGSELDVATLALLSPDAVPVLVAAYQDQALPAVTRAAVGAALVCRQQVSPSRVDQDWRSFTLSGLQADKALRLVQSSLDGYQVMKVDWDVQVISPGSTTYDCYQTGGGSNPNLFQPYIRAGFSLPGLAFLPDQNDYSGGGCGSEICELHPKKIEHFQGGQVAHLHAVV